MLRPPRSVVSVLSRQVERSTGARCLSSGTPPVLNPFKPRGGPRTSRSGRSTRQDPSSSSTGPQYDPPPESRYQQSPGSQGYGFGGTGTGAGGFGGSPFSPFGAAAGGFGGGGNSFSSTDPAAVPVHIPSDPEGVLRETDGATRLLGNSALVIVRQLEMLNVFMGFEQANRYAILSPQGDHVGYMAEEDQGFLTTLQRQFFRTHRPFRSVVMDREGVPVLFIRRPFAFINSRIFVNGEQGAGVDDKLVGEAQQEWHPWRRRYNLFKHRQGSFKQFARIDSGLWAWDFWLQDEQERTVASINRNFAGFGRELFTDTGQYVVRFDAVEQELLLNASTDASKDPSIPRPSLVIPPTSSLTLDERAMTLATAVSIDFDYFSRHSGGGGLGFPFFIWGGGGGGDELGRGGGGGAAAGGVAGAAEAGEGEFVGEQDPESFPEEEVWGESSGFDDVGGGDGDGW